MILPFDHEAQSKVTCPTFGSECANVLFQRGLITEKTMQQVAEVIGQSIGAAELAALELSQRNLITQQNRAVVSEFIKRVAKRMQLKAKGLTDCEAGRHHNGARARVYRVLKRTNLLTTDHLSTLVSRLVVSTHTPDA
jgi:antitoxin component HigA of HigAB toxin-antitoxin module